MTGPTSLPAQADLATEPAADSAGWPGLLLAADPAPDALLPCFPLAALDVRGRLDGLTAHVEVVQRFVNTGGKPAEATYVFPLPDRLTVTRFRLETAARAVEAELRERRRPGPGDDRGVRDSPSAAMFEEDRPPVFTVRAGTVMPGEEVTVRLALVGSLPCTDGEVEFRFPLTVAPRYLPAAAPPADSADAQVTPLPWLGDSPDLSVVVDVYPAGLGVADVRTSLPAILEAGDDGTARVTAGAFGVPGHDFVLRYRIGADTVRAALQVLPDGPGEEEGSFALTVVAPPGAAGGRPRDVVFALDRSAAMDGWKLVAARRAVAGLVEALGPRDRFAVLAFDHEVVTPPRFGGARFVAADGPHRGHAAEFLARLPARGGAADAAPALDLAAALLAPADPARDRVLVLVTAGRVGDENPILRVWAGRARGARPLCLGVDRAGGDFLRKLAELGGGACELVDSSDRLDAAADRLRVRLGPPALAGLTLAAAGFEVVPDTVAPARVADLYPGAAVCVRGRYRGRPDGSATLSATAADGRPWGTTVPARVTVNPALAAAWARGYVRQLEDRFVTRAAERPALERRAVATSLRFGVVSRFTAFVAVERPVAKSGPASAIMAARPSGPDGSRPPRGRSAIANHEPNDEPIRGYVLVEFLGRGQFGEVWKARDKVSGKLVAVKVIDLTYSPTALRDTRRLTVLENLNHPHLIPIIAARLKDAAGRELDLGQADEARKRGELRELVFATGLGEKSLAARLRELNPGDTPPDRRRGLPVAELIRYMRGAAKGIDYLNRPSHGLGPGDGPIVHCGIKPDDMLIVAGEVQVADAGFARIITPDARYTRVTGSPAYSAPELTANKPGPGTDQYSLAVVYYELRTGRLPFPPDAGIQQVILAHAAGDLDFTAPPVTDEERYLLRRATARDPVDRFESCEEFVEELVALPEIWAQLRAKKAVRSDEFLLAQEPPAPVTDEARETKTWAPPPGPVPAKPAAVPAVPPVLGPPEPALPPTGTGYFASGEFDLDDPRASAPWLATAALPGLPPEPPPAEPAPPAAPAPVRLDTSTVTYNPDPPPTVTAATTAPAAPDDDDEPSTPDLLPEPAPDPDILAIIRGAGAPAEPLAAPPPSTDLQPAPDADILAIIRGAGSQAEGPAPPPVRPASKSTIPVGATGEDSGPPTRWLPEPAPPPPPPPAKPAPPPPVVAPAARETPKPSADTPKAIPPIPPPAGPAAPMWKSFGMPVDPTDPLGKRYATAEPDTMIRQIIADADRVGSPPRSIPPIDKAPAVKPAKPVPPPPPPADKKKRPPKPVEPPSQQTAALGEEEIQRILAEAQRITDQRAAAKPSAAKPPEAKPPAKPVPPKRPAVPPPPPPKPPSAARPSPIPPAPPAASTADDSPSKPEWYREAVREQRQASQRQVTQSKASGMTTHWKEPKKSTAWVWVVVAVVVLGLAAAVGVILGRG